MKLLFVEDERLTREGIREAIEWDKLGITEIVEAVDGQQALSVAERFRPDIVLTDIRMPRLDGVAMATELRKMDPGCKLIFMSGYADKQYLKAAISLKAIQYIEKPIEIEEIAEAVGNAVAECLEERRYEQTVSFAKETLDAGSPLVRQEAALQFISGAYDEPQLLRRLELAGFKLPFPFAGVTLLIKAISPDSRKETIAELTDEALRDWEGAYLYASKNELYDIVHLFETERCHLDAAVVLAVCKRLSAALSFQYERYTITAGDIVGDLESMKTSYTTAVVRMQEAFYKPPRAIVVRDRSSSSLPEEDKRRLVHELKDALHHERFDEADAAVQRLTSIIREFPSELVSATKDMYYRIVMEMESFANSRGIELFPASDRSNPPWEWVHQCHYLDDVQEAVRMKLKQLHEAVAERGKGGTASRIMKYIHLHYAKDDLSVGEISEHLQMTSSHLIAVFKESTGHTVKQYLTEYRIGRAKQLLVQERLKMMDVAAQSGFKDGEYFAKLFRKHTGMTPSEYRERYRP